MKSPAPPREPTASRHVGLRNPDVFDRWRRLGLTYMFLGIEALDEQGLQLYRKRVSPETNIRALELGRRLNITVAINLIVAAQADHSRPPSVRHPARGAAHGLPLDRFYEELVKTQAVLNRKHLGVGR